ncbi:hypothetical protein ACFR9U_04200 [Halorientalis brevis]|uniref:Uncharacterized protein n=1 Tax=Halorientalis brevis TaxID=1126241 RepID=A0ABD6C7C9_9EURY|nr:hypothetical protein [Halorientalis brevis]
MTDIDEKLLTAAKLREQVRGDLDGGDPRLLPHTGMVTNERDRAVLSFLETADVPGSADLKGCNSFAETDLGDTVTSKVLTDELSKAVVDGNASMLAYAVGVTEQDLDGSALRLPMMLNDQLHNNDAPAFILGAGNPNTGKTNTMSLLAELRSYALDDYLVLSNSRSWDLTDVVVTSAHDLAVALLEHRDVPKFLMIDEASTHFDARTHRREVATQWTPLAKRFAKIGVDACGLVVHTGKDCHPEAKRLATLAYYKTQKDVVEFYERWPADGDFPADQLFNGSIEDLEPTSVHYDPDDAAPWDWNLESELFTLDLSWSKILDRLSNDGEYD